MSAERGHGSKSRVHFLGYSLNPVLGQKWVKENFTITNFEYAVYLLVYEILFFFSLSIKPVNKEETNTTVV